MVPVKNIGVIVVVGDGGVFAFAFAPDGLTQGASEKGVAVVGNVMVRTGI